MKITTMNEPQHRKLAVLLLLAIAGSADGAEQTVTPDRLASLQRMISPQPDESRWAKVPWETNLKQARERASREDKPLFLWRSGGGDVLGRT